MGVKQALSNHFKKPRYRPLLVEGLSGGSACDAALYGLGFLCSRELRRKLGAWEPSGVKGTRAKLSADGASAVLEDSASDIDSGPLLLPANAEAASGMSARGEEATGKGVPKPPAAELGAG